LWEQDSAGFVARRFKTAERAVSRAKTKKALRKPSPLGPREAARIQRITLTY
jgi:hypothetical protein